LQFILEDDNNMIIIATALRPVMTHFLGQDVDASMRTEAGRGRVRFKLEGLSSQLVNKWHECTVQSSPAAAQFGGQCYYLLNIAGAGM